LLPKGSTLAELASPAALAPKNLKWSRLDIFGGLIWLGLLCGPSRAVVRQENTPSREAVQMI
jgi:hypothetical protein